MADKTTHKERTRARILNEAAQALRVSGTESLSVGALMRRAGLTHGGFYAHFSSRDDLVAHAVQRMFDDSARMLDRFLIEGAGGSELAALIDCYLSEQALDSPERACPVPGLAGEVSRMPAGARTNFETGIQHFLGRLTGILIAMGRENAADLGRSALAEMVGAMAIARTLSDRQAAVSFLACSRVSLADRLGLR